MKRKEVIGNLVVIIWTTRSCQPRHNSLSWIELCIWIVLLLIHKLMESLMDIIYSNGHKVDS